MTFILTTIVVVIIVGAILSVMDNPNRDINYDKPPPP